MVWKRISEKLQEYLGVSISGYVLYRCCLCEYVDVCDDVWIKCAGDIHMVKLCTSKTKLLRSQRERASDMCKDKQRHTHARTHASKKKKKNVDY